MGKLETLVLDCEEYAAPDVDRIYNSSSRLYFTLTRGFIQYDDGRIRYLTLGEGEYLKKHLSDKEPISSSLEVLNYDGDYYVSEPCNKVEVGAYYLLDDETVFTVISEENRYYSDKPICDLNERGRINSDTKTVYIVEKEHPRFERIEYPKGSVRKLIRSERVEKLAKLK